MRERVCEFGPQLNLTGLLTEPTATTHPELPAVVMLNAGLLHRVGPHRMSVILARKLAEQGVTSLRFDLGGRGDSNASGQAESDEDQVQADIVDALNYLEAKRGFQTFVLLGLCAGADNAHAVALRDPRVVGAVFLDGHGYWTRRSYMEYYLPRLARPSSWLSFARRNLAAQKQDEEDVGGHGRRKPFGPRHQVEHEIQSLVNRNAQLLYVYTGGVTSYYNYTRQFFDMFAGLKPRDRISVEYYPNADHTYTFSEDRERMVERVVEWFGSCDWSVDRARHSSTSSNPAVQNVSAEHTAA
jgi:dienelactone hydrolase